MLREQFIAKTIIMVVLGVMLVYAAIAQAESHPIANDKKRSFIMVIFAIVCALVTVFYACVAINSIVFMAFPTEMLPQPITPNTIYRHTSVQQIWGAATLDQITFFSALTAAILFLAISCYLFAYKKSESKIWAKVLKVMNFILAYSILCNTYFIYFDFWEFLPLIVLGLLMTFNIYIVKKYGYYI